MRADEYHPPKTQWDGLWHLPRFVGRRIVGPLCGANSATVAHPITTHGATCEDCIAAQRREEER